MAGVKVNVTVIGSHLVLLMLVMTIGPVLAVNHVSVNNPFVKDPSADQLPMWALAHPGGAGLRTTNAAGNPLPSNTASLAVQITVNGLNNNRQQLLFDPVLANKLASFNRERIPERVVHANGQGAFGHFVVTNDVTRWTKAKLFNRIGKVTPVFVRFSSTVGGSSSSQTLHDPRGFSLRFYTEDGNLDFPGLPVDVFSLRDPMIFVDAKRTSRKNPETGVVDRNQVYDFLSLRPEIIHSFLKTTSDSGQPGSMRGMNGSAVSANSCINSKGVLVWCKFSWHTWQPVTPLTDAETVSLAGTNPDFYTEELYNAIESGNYPKWTFGVQYMTQEQANSLPFNPFDATKAWHLSEFPFNPIGVFVLDRNPTDYFTQIEQAAFCPGNVVPGIDLSPDPVLVARAFAYKDAQRYRLGPNFESIEVNRPISKVQGYERDGNMRLSAKDNGNGGPVYFPNSFNGPRIDPEASITTAFPVSGYISRVDSGDEDNFSQAIQYLRTEVGPAERDRIATRIATALSSVIPSLRGRVLVNCIYPLGRDFGDAVVRALEVLEDNAALNSSNSINYNN